MSVWAWVGIGFGAFLLVSLVVGVALAAILGQISRDVSELLDEELWASAPMRRAWDSLPEESTAPTAGEKTPH